MKKLLFLLIFIFSWFLLTGSTLNVGSWNCSKISGSGVYDSKCIGYVKGNLKVIYKGQTKNNKPSGKGILTIPDGPGDYLEGTWKNGTLINGVAFLSGTKIFFKNGKAINKPSSKKKLDLTWDPPKNRKKNSSGGLFAVLLSFIIIPAIVFFPLNIFYRSTTNSFLRGAIIVGGVIIFYYIFGNFQNRMNVDLNDQNCKPSYWRSC